MPVRLVAIAVVILSMYMLPAASQDNSSTADPASSPQAVNPLQNPFYLFPWIANTTPGLAAEIDAQGLSSEWMNMQWMMMMANHFWNAPIDEATRFGVLDAMLRAANTQLLEGMFGGSNQAKMWIPSQNRRISIMADKMPVAEDVSFDDAVDSMKLRANEINFKFVGHSPLWKDIVAITGDEDTPRVEIFNFCDAVVARKVLDHAPEFIVFIPCRIALIEDAEGKLWVMTLDWDVNWLNLAQNPNSVLDKELRDEAVRIREGIRYIMEGAASGDF
jgi:uncharacterized protein (DUF302 family)